MPINKCHSLTIRHLLIAPALSASGCRGASTGCCRGAARTCWVRSLSEPLTYRTTWEVGIIHVTDVAVPTPGRAWRAIYAFSYCPTFETTRRSAAHGGPDIVRKSVPIVVANVGPSVPGPNSRAGHRDYA